MARKTTRVRKSRRDRRKAKACGFKRPGRSNPRKAGHGGAGQVTPKPQSKGRAVESSGAVPPGPFVNGRFDWKLARLFVPMAVLASGDVPVPTWVPVSFEKNPLKKPKEKK